MGLRLLDAWLLGAGSLGAGSLGALVSEAAVRYLLRPSNALGGTLCHYFRKGPICAELGRPTMFGAVTGSILRVDMSMNGRALAGV